MTNQDIIQSYEDGLNHFVYSDKFGENHINTDLLNEWLASQPNEVLIYTKDKFEKHNIMGVSLAIKNILSTRKLTNIKNQMN